MTINELIKKLDAEIINVSEGEKDVANGYCGDFLSNVISKADKNCMWFTVMNNVNVAAVACLSDVGIVILCEGVKPDEQLLEKVKEHDVQIISTKHSVYEGCRLT